MKRIQHIVDPERLLLVWKPPLETHESRSNLAVGSIDKDGTLLYLTEADDYQKAIEQGFTGYPAFSLERMRHDNVLPTFLRRLPPRQRSDFQDFLAYYRLPPEGTLSDFALLANTGGRLPRDGFSVIPDLSQVKLPCELLLEVVGARHAPAIQEGYRPVVGSAARFQAEPSNAHDPNAVQVLLEDRRVGYVNRLQAKVLNRWLNPETVIDARVDRINGTEERPVIYLLIKVVSRESC
ncbi:MAG: HIRAN domain-containing protein [Magnetococcales bacterium]|nr:HIRAN domain-containing protein [Magnetococcales bacterium]MBF0114492.1 HIRAN domain-containing protein [Magnetococcales bacterium]